MDLSQTRKANLEAFYGRLAGLDPIANFRTNYLLPVVEEVPMDGGGERVTWDLVGLYRLRARLEPRGEHRVTVMGNAALSERLLHDGSRVVELVKFDGDNKIFSHAGYVAPSRRAREPEPDPERPALLAAVLSAGQAIETASEQDSEGAMKGGWRLSLDAPRWSLAQGGSPPLILYVLGAVWLALAITLLLALPGRLKTGQTGGSLDATTAAAFAIGAWAVVAIMGLVLWRGFAQWRNVSRMQLEVERTAPPEPFIVYTEGGDGNGSDEDEEEQTEASAKAKPGKVAMLAKPAPTPVVVAPSVDGTQPKAPTLAREPVALGSIVVAGGTLAAGLAGVASSTLGAVAAGTIVATGLAARQVVTPVFDAVDNAGRRLLPARKAR